VNFPFIWDYVQLELAVRTNERTNERTERYSYC